MSDVIIHFSALWKYAITDFVDLAEISMTVESYSSTSGVQTLVRGLAVIDAIAAGHHDLRSIGQYIGASRSTTHRLISALIQERYLRQIASRGYSLGSKLIELGSLSLNRYPLLIAARPFLDALAELTQDTVHLGIREQGDVLYIDKISGTRGLEMRSRVGHRMPLFSTGIGKALMLDASVAEWRHYYNLHNPDADSGSFIRTMKHYVSRGYTYDLEENELTIRCVAAPVHDAGNRVVAAVSVASITPYMPESRMSALSIIVKSHADSISTELGWNNHRMCSMNTFNSIYSTGS